MKKIISFLIMFSVFVYPATTSADTAEKVDFHLTENEVAVSFLDFSSGEATLIQSGTGKNILINTGGPSTKKELKNHLNMYGVDKVDSLIITNKGPQYTANLSWLLKHGMVKKISSSSGILDDLMKKQPLTGVEMEEWKAGGLHELIPGMIVKVLYVFQGSKAEESVEVKATEEEESKIVEAEDRDADGALVLSFIYGKNRLLYMGATSPDIERKLVESEPLKSEIIKLPEFANVGSEQFFLEKVDPEVAIIFNERDKLPKQSIVERLEESWIETYTTKRFGNISLKSDPENYELITVPIKEYQDQN